MNDTVTPADLAALFALIQGESALVLDEWLTVPEAAATAKVSRSKLYEWMQEGLPFLDESPRQIRRSALLQFKADKEVTVVRNKKVSSQRGATLRRPGRAAARRTNIKPSAAAQSLATGPTDKSALLALLADSQRAAA